jgi:hypothetical protein
MFVGDGRAVAEGGMQPRRFVPAFDEAEAGDLRLGLRRKAAAFVNQHRTRDPALAKLPPGFDVENPLNRRVLIGADRDPTETLIMALNERVSSNRERGPGSMLIHSSARLHHL